MSLVLRYSLHRTWMKLSMPPSREQCWKTQYVKVFLTIVRGHSVICSVQCLCQLACTDPSQACKPLISSTDALSKIGLLAILTTSIVFLVLSQLCPHRQYYLIFGGSMMYSSGSGNVDMMSSAENCQLRPRVLEWQW